MSSQFSDLKELIRIAETRLPETQEGMVDTGYKDFDVERKGTKIILPPDMTYDTAINWLKRKRKQEESEVEVSESIRAFPLDGAVALADVLKEIYGWTDLVSTFGGFLGMMEFKPTLIAVDIGPNETIQVPWGNIQIPGIEGTLETGWEMNDEMPCFVLKATIKRKHEKVIHQLADAVRERIKTHSIYRGKAIRMSFRDTEGNRKDFNPSNCPRFEDPTQVTSDDLIFDAETEAILRTALFTPVKYADACRTYRTPLKRGVLLEGPYGTGKTLTAGALAGICVTAPKPWTFLYVEDVRDLDLAIRFARLYQPTVVFGEDIDRAVGMNRDTEVDRILNSLDGIGSKSNEIFVVLTTNDVEVINPAFIRPGRIDTVVHIGPPDVEASVRLIRLYGGSLLDERATDEMLAEAVWPVVGSNAAFLREVTERSKLHAISRSEGREMIISAEDIKHAALQMANHQRLADPTKKGEGPSPMESVGDFVAGRVTGSEPFKKLDRRVRDVEDIIKGNC